MTKLLPEAPYTVMDADADADFSAVAQAYVDHCRALSAKNSAAEFLAVASPDEIDGTAVSLAVQGALMSAQGKVQTFENLGFIVGSALATVWLDRYSDVGGTSSSVLPVLDGFHRALRAYAAAAAKARAS